MDQILKQLEDMFGSFWDSPLVQLGLRAIAVYFVILWLAAAYWAFRDMQLRTSNPILPYFAASLIIIFTPVFFVFAVIAYRIVRPQEKIGETYERTLAEEALLAEVESVKSCPTCARRVDEEWIICPTCRTRLNRVCPNCSRLVGLDWSLCAWCGRDFERAAPPAEAIAAPRPSATYSEPAFAARPSPALEATAYRATMPAATPMVRDVAAPDFVRRDAPSSRADNPQTSARLGVVRDDGRSGRTDDLWAPPPPPPAIVPPPPPSLVPPPAIVPPPAAIPPSGSRASTAQARPMGPTTPRSTTSSKSSGLPPASSTDPLAER
jgi:RNA polymerase subunit RPABC4/transcription elongation factor Spt4